MGIGCRAPGYRISSVGVGLYNHNLVNLISSSITYTHTGI